MPNHVRNRLIIKAEEPLLKRITEFLKGEPDEDGQISHIDFNKIIPMPKDLMVEKSSRGEMGEVILSKKGYYAGKTYPEVKEIFDSLKPEEQKEALQLARKYRSNRKKYGHETWYEWAYANWGTKWNAYHQSMPNTNEIWFDTAWSCVVQLIGELAKKFPTAVFDYTWADEDTGYNCGKVKIKNKRGWVHQPDGGTKEAYEIAFEMRPELRGYFKLVDDNYEYSNDFS